MAALKQECDADDDGCSEACGPEEEKSLEPQSHSSHCKGSSKERDQGAEGEAGYWHLPSH